MRTVAFFPAVLSRVLPTAIAAWALASGAHAVAYGSFPGSGVDFEALEDNHGRFGTPTVIGDTLSFDSADFSAECATACSTADTVDDTIQMTIRAKPGASIPRIVLEESGQASLSTSMLELAAASVTASVFIDVFEVDGTAINNINAPGSLAFTPSSGDYDTVNDGSGSFDWTGRAVIDLDAVLAAEGLVGGATLIVLTLDNTLTAFSSGSSSAATITKTSAPTLAIVPEPATGVLLVLGLAVMAGPVARAHPARIPRGTVETYLRRAPAAR